MNGTFGWGLPPAASTFAGEIDFGIRLIHWAMLAIFVLWGVFFTYLLIRYRRREGVPAEATHDGPLKSLIPDACILVFELGLLFFYAIPAWSKIKFDLPAPEQANNVQIIAEQFAWNAQYPGKDGKFGRRDAKFIDSGNVLGLDPEDPAGKDDIVGLNELHVPLGKKTLVQLTSKDVIHSFFVPEFRVKQDAVPGMELPFWFEPSIAGKFEIACAQLCGLAHTNMRGDVYAHSPKEYQDWLKSQTPGK